MKNRTLASLLIVSSMVSTSLASCASHAMTHVVRKGESLASIAKHYYGRSDFERVLVGANALDSQGGSSIAPGMRLEIPTLTYSRTALGDSWWKLADRFLGDSRYAPVLASANDAKAYYLPDPGTEFVIPYVLRHYARVNETIFDVAAKYLGDKMLAWTLVVFNNLDEKGNDIKRGDVILVPLKTLPLTKEGEAARLRAQKQDEDILGKGYMLQRHVEQQLPELLRLVDQGRYVEAVVLGEKLRTVAPLTRTQQARIAKQLTVAFVALDATSLALEACKIYLSNANRIRLEPSRTSPKVRAVCMRAGYKD